MKKKNNSKREIAIKVKNLSKSFEIPHEKIDTIRGAFVDVFKRKEYEVFKALDNISFEVKKGEFFGIIGRNGSGKSTLLKILAKIYTQDSGSVAINGKISPFLELGIGFNPELSGRDNVYLNGTVLGLTKRQIDEKFDSIVKFSELERFIDQKLKNYSSGMQVRLAFSVSIHANRDILLMDEVLAVGDNNFQAKCIEEFNKYRDAGKTVILVTHDIGTAQRYCDRVMLLRNGKVEMIGKPERVGSKYIYQNMSDEEKRILREENEKREKERRREVMSKKEEAKRQKKKEAMRKVAEIKKVEFLNKEGVAKNVFRTGDSLNIKVFFNVQKHIKKLNLGIGMHSTEGGVVFGYNTEIDEFEIKRNKNSVSLCIDSLPVLKGEYFVNVTLYGKAVEILYDFKAKCKTIKVYSFGNKSEYGGLFFIEHEWK